MIEFQHGGLLQGARRKEAGFPGAVKGGTMQERAPGCGRRLRGPVRAGASGGPGSLRILGF
jgi:hypothetical protein